MGGSVGEEGPLKKDDLPQAPPRPDGGCCLCSSADQRETGGGTSADPADPSDPASHRFPQQRIRFEICLCPLSPAQDHLRRPVRHRANQHCPRCPSAGCSSSKRCLGTT